MFLDSKGTTRPRDANRFDLWKPWFEIQPVGAGGNRSAMDIAAHELAADLAGEVCSLAECFGVGGHIVVVRGP